MSYSVLLACVGNPDFRQDPDRPLCGVESGAWKPIAALDDAGRACRDYIEANDLGGGNWSGGLIKDEANVIVGYVSYNGRRWGTDHEHFPAHLVPDGMAVEGREPYAAAAPGR